MTIINGYKKPWKWLKHISIHAYKWCDSACCPDLNKKFSKIGIRLEDDKCNFFKSLFIVYWPRRYVVISWDNTKCGECSGG